MSSVTVLKIVCNMVFKRMSSVNETRFLQNLIIEPLLLVPVSLEIISLCFAFGFL